MARSSVNYLKLRTLGSPPSPVVQSLTASSLGLYPYFTLNCSSSGSAATEVMWTLDNQPINADSQFHVTFQMLRDGTTSSYDNLLSVLSGSVNDYSGQYGCTVRNRFNSATHQVNLLGNEFSLINYSVHSALSTRIFYRH